MSAPSNNDPSKPRLTDSQKKANHILSEQKRREAIRKGFDRLAEIVPGMEGQGRSEAMVLAATVEYMKVQMRRKEELRRVAREKGWTEGEFERVYAEVGEGLGMEGQQGSSGGLGGGGSSGERRGSSAQK